MKISQSNDKSIIQSQMQQLGYNNKQINIEFLKGGCLNKNMLQPFFEEEWKSINFIQPIFQKLSLIIKAKVINIFFRNICNNFKINYCPNQIITMITFVHFQNLKQLNLQSNHIYKIQFLSHLNAKELRKLSLRQNEIEQIKSIRKCIFPQLELLNLNRNPILSYHSLSQMHIPKLKTLYLNSQKNIYYLYQWWFNYKQNEDTPINLLRPCNDFSFYFKINCEKLSMEYESALIIPMNKHFVFEVIQKNKKRAVCQS